MDEIFIVMGLVLVVSFLGFTFFRKTKIPNPVLLIIIGIALSIWKNPIDLTVLQSLAPAFGSFSLLLILLEAGLDLDIRHFFKSIGPSIIFGTSSYLLAVICITYVLKTFFSYNSLNSLMLAFVSVGCSPTILMPILKSMSIEKDKKTFLDLECTVTEVLGLILTVSFTPFLLSSLNGVPLVVTDLIFASGNKVIIILISALFVPFFIGMVWSRLLSYAGEKPLWPILTIGVTLLLYGATESVGGKGALNVLIFGLVIGNTRIIRVFFVKAFSKLSWTGRKGKKILSFFVGQHFAEIHHISREFSFFVRTFFFVYLGAIVDFTQFNSKVFGVVCVLTFLPMLVRFLLANFFNRISLFPFPPVNLLTCFTPRGLANALAVFAIIDFSKHVNSPSNIIESLRASLIPPVFGVIILSNIVLTLFLIFRREGKLLSTKLEELE